MFHIVLVSPEIPPNTGNVIRLAANTGAHLHLVRPLGFELDDKRLRRAGLDYHEWANVRLYDSLSEVLFEIGAPQAHCFAMTTKGRALVGRQQFHEGDVFVFGCETAGLSADQLALFPREQWFRLPMRQGQRSLNLSNAVAVTIYEAWRQTGYLGGI
jgi:tRNA (cytidine/uridine-2'-O-)-methyltransferase